MPNPLKGDSHNWRRIFICSTKALSQSQTTCNMQKSQPINLLCSMISSRQWRSHIEEPRSMVLMKTTRTFASPCKFMKVPLHLMSCMKSLSILKHISSMKHKRRQISPTCQLPQISHIKHFTIHLDTKCQTIHPTHQVKNKKNLLFPKNGLSTYSPTKFLCLTNIYVPTLASVSSIAKEVTLWNTALYSNTYLGLTTLNPIPITIHPILLKLILHLLLHPPKLNDFFTLVHPTIWHLIFKIYLITLIIPQ